MARKAKGQKWKTEIKKEKSKHTSVSYDQDPVILIAQRNHHPTTSVCNSPSQKFCFFLSHTHSFIPFSFSLSPLIFRLNKFLSNWFVPNQRLFHLCMQKLSSNLSFGQSTVSLSAITYIYFPIFNPTKPWKTMHTRSVWICLLYISNDSCQRLAMST